MSTDAAVAGLIEGYLEGVFEHHDRLIAEEGMSAFVQAVVNQVVITHGVTSLSADYVADEARAYAREYLRDLDEEI